MDLELEDPMYAVSPPGFDTLLEMLPCSKRTEVLSGHEGCDILCFHRSYLKCYFLQMLTAHQKGVGKWKLSIAAKAMCPVKLLFPLAIPLCAEELSYCTSWCRWHQSRR